MSRTWAAIALTAAALPTLGQPPKKHPDYVPDSKTAKRIGEAVLIARYGEERVKAQLPLTVSPSPGGLWIVQVTEQGPPHTGGGMAVMINKYSGCIENVMPYMK
jgi:NTF2 fold immunity protein